MKYVEAVARDVVALFDQNVDRQAAVEMLIRVVLTDAAAVARSAIGCGRSPAAMQRMVIDLADREKVSK